MQFVGVEGLGAGHAETCWAARRARRYRIGGVSCAPRSTASSAAGIPAPRSGWPARTAPARRLVHAVVGAADALGRRLAPFGAPTWMTRSTSPQSMPRSSVEVRPRRAACRRHRRLDLAALLDVERAVMQRDGQAVVVDGPEFLEQHLGLAARVDEEQRRPCAGSPRRPRDGVAGRMPGPRHMRSRLEDGDMRLRPAGHGDERAAASRLRGCGTSQRRSSSGSATVADRPIVREIRRERAQPREPERQQMAALRGDQRMQLVEDDARRSSKKRRVLRGEQQGQLLGRRQQDVGRDRALALARVLGVSPVRVSTLIGSPISATGSPRLRSMSTASALSGEI
jgi:hypothetical protein